MENEIEDFIKTYCGETLDIIHPMNQPYVIQELKKALVEFARMKVETALTEASESVEIYFYYEDPFVDKDSILDNSVLNSLKP